MTDAYSGILLSLTEEGNSLHLLHRYKLEDIMLTFEISQAEKENPVWFNFYDVWAVKFRDRK